MRFRTTQRPRGLLKARDQRRLVFLTLAFGAILLGVSVTRHSELWATLFQAEATIVAEPAKPPAVDSSEDRRDEDAGLRDDEFWSSSDNNALDSQNVVNHQTLKLGAPEKGLKYDKYGLPQVPSHLIKNVRDNVIGIHSTEAEAYDTSMKLAGKLDSSRNLKAQPGSYPLFIDAPQTARGRAFRIKGQLRRLTRITGRLNAIEVGSVYDAWLNTSDSGEQMLHVVSSSVDDKLARLIAADDADQSVDFDIKKAPDIHFTGYFFKKEAYASRNAHGLSVAPMFVSNLLKNTPLQTATAGRAEKLTPYLKGLAFLIVAAVGLVWWNFWASDSAHQSTRTHQLTRLPAVVTFEGVEMETVDETLSRLEAAGQHQG